MLVNELYRWWCRPHPPQRSPSSVGLATGGVERGRPPRPRYWSRCLPVCPRGSVLISSLGALSLMLDHGRRRQVEEVEGRWKRDNPFFSKKRGRNAVEFAKNEGLNSVDVFNFVFGANEVSKMRIMVKRSFCVAKCRAECCPEIDFSCLRLFDADQTYQ